MSRRVRGATFPAVFSSTSAAIAIFWPATCARTNTQTTMQRRSRRSAHTAGVHGPAAQAAKSYLVVGGSEVVIIQRWHEVLKRPAWFDTTMPSAVRQVYVCTHCHTSGTYFANASNSDSKAIGSSATAAADTST